MKNALLFISIIFFSVILSTVSFCEEVAVREWSPYSGIEGISFKDNILAFHSTSSMPLLASKSDIFINASRQKVLELKMRSNKSYMTGRLFFRRIGDAGFNYSNSFEFQTGLNNMYHKYLIDLSRNPNWFGTVSQIMISPINGAGSVDIESVKFIEPNIWLAASAFWRDFFTFEVPQVRMANFIYGQKMNGISVYRYVYCLIIIILLLVISLQYIKYKDIKVISRSLPAMILLTCLSFWMILDFRTLFDQARAVTLDAQTFYGKSLEEKRALTNLGDFYGFLTFADSKLPKNSSFNILNPSYYYFNEKAVYYLYPRRFDAKAAYVLAYNPDGSQDNAVNALVKNNCRVFSKYKDGEFILKK